LHERAEAATSQGNDISADLRALRGSYYEDCKFLVDNFARIGVELKSYPAKFRNMHLKNALRQCNGFIFHRMVSRVTLPQERQSAVKQEADRAHYYDPYGLEGHSAPHQDSFGYGEDSYHWSGYRSETVELSSMSPQEVAKLCPAAAFHSLHLPLQHSRDGVLRLLRIAEEECEVLPSKERCPYLVVVEVLEQPYSCNSPMLYSHGYEAMREMLARRLTATDVDTEFSHSEPSVAREVDLAAALATPSAEQLLEEDEHLNGRPTSHENVAAFARPDFHPASQDSGVDGKEVNRKLFDASGDVLRGGMTPHSPLSQGGEPFHRDYCEPSITVGPSSAPQDYPPYPTYGGEYPAANPWDPSAADQLYPYEQRLDVFDMGRQELQQHVPVRKKTWAERRDIVRHTSPFGHFPGWGLRSFIVKAGDDLRREVLAMQLIEYCQKVFQVEGLDIFLRPYQIVSTGRDCGLVEFIENAQSLDKIKKTFRPFVGGRAGGSGDLSLREFFEFSFGASYSLVYSKAVHNFVRSLAGYSLLTYLLQVKDRHNANIMIDNEGHILHIDYGFILGDSPGFNINFESAPFKFTRDYADVMGGVDSDAFRTFEDLFLRGFMALQRHTEGLSAIVQLFCGDKKKNCADSLRTRLMFPTSEMDILSLVRDSIDNWRTKQYDWYQQKTNNIQM